PPRTPVTGAELIVELHRPPILVPGDRTVPRRIRDHVPSGAGHEPAGNVPKRLEERLVTRPQLAQVGPVELTPARIEPGIERRDGGGPAAGPRPSSFPPRRPRGTHAPPQSLDPEPL